MATTYNAGIVTAYGAAVRGGYTGTYEQYCEEQAHIGTNAQRAEAAADRAESAAEKLDEAVPTAVRESLYALLNNALYLDTGLKDEIAVISAWAGNVTSVELNQTTIAITGETTAQLIATTIPAGAEVSWASSDVSVATVDQNGLVTGVDNGTAIITAISGAVSATCIATVSGFANITSIGAVYTKTANVYETDALDNLKNDLVVTAYFDDDTSVTLNGSQYSLSGTLAEGTNTITVTYRGFTTTFLVSVESVPEGYTALNYAEFSGSQYVLSGVYEAATIPSAEYKFRRTGTANPNYHIFSAKNTFYPYASTEKTEGIYIWKANYNGNQEDTWSHYDWTTTADYTVVVDASSSKVYINGDETDGVVVAGSTFSASNQFAIGAYGGGLTTAKYKLIGRIYYLKLYNNSGVLHYFKPARRNNDSVIGFYDLVENTFLVPSGTLGGA